MTKKVLIFIEDTTFTYDNRVIRETSTLVQEGWEVTVISQKCPGDPFYRKINGKLRAYFFPKPTAQGAWGHILEHAISLVVGSLLTLWVYIRHGFSVFHACNPMDILWVIALPYKLLGVKFIYDQHDLCPEIFISRGDGDKNSLFYKILLFLEKLSYRTADSVICTNESYKEIAIERGGRNQGDVFVVRNGPNLDQFKPSLPEPNLKKRDKILVGYLGNMNIQDGVDYLVEAAHEIINKRKRSDILFVLIGGGSVQRLLVRRVSEMGLKNSVLFKGRMVPDKKMMAVLSACDICVQPDPPNLLNDKSTMCKAMEYMALNKPVIAFDLKETKVSCGDVALYVSENSSVALADSILQLADNPELRREMGEKGRRRIERSFSWEHSVPKFLAAYKHALMKSKDF